MPIGGTADVGQPLLAREQLIGDLAANRADAAVQRELADEQAAIEPVDGNLPGEREDRHGDRQVEARPGFADVSRRKAHGKRAARDIEPARSQCAPYAAARLHDRGVGHADDGQARYGSRGGDLDGHPEGLHAPQARRMDGERGAPRAH